MSDSGNDHELAFEWTALRTADAVSGMDENGTAAAGELPPSNFGTRQVFQSERSRASAVSSLTDVPLHIEAVIGGVSLSVADLTRVREGDALVLDSRFGEPIELRLNGSTIGYGEIVADNDDNLIGIRMTKLISLR